MRPNRLVGREGVIAQRVRVRTGVTIREMSCSGAVARVTSEEPRS